MKYKRSVLKGGTAGRKLDRGSILGKTWLEEDKVRFYFMDTVFDALNIFFLKANGIVWVLKVPNSRSYNNFGSNHYFTS